MIEGVKKGAGVMGGGGRPGLRDGRVSGEAAGHRGRGSGVGNKMPAPTKRSSMASVERSCARLLKHRCRVARYQALLVGRDDPDRNGRVVGADQSLAAVFIARGIESGARPA